MSCLKTTASRGLPELGLAEVERELPHSRQVYVGKAPACCRARSKRPAAKQSKAAMSAAESDCQIDHQGSAGFAAYRSAANRCVPEVFDGGGKIAVWRTGAEAPGSTRQAYPRSKNDLLAIMVGRAELLRAGGPRWRDHRRQLLSSKLAMSKWCVIKQR